MQILTDFNVCHFHGTITKGRWENDPSVDTYKIENENGTFYAVTGFVKYDDVTLPEDYEDVKYCYTEERGFYLNPDWEEPDPSAFDKLEAQALYTAMMTDTILED